MTKEQGKSQRAASKILRGFLGKSGRKGGQEAQGPWPEKHRNIWFGLGMFGIVGWSVAIPTLLGAALGIWIDAHYPSRFSWTLMFLFLGVGLGSANAWYWVNRVGKNG